MAKVQEKRQAISLRKAGHTYSEILSRIPNVSKGTLSLWCSNIELTPKQIENIANRSESNREISRFAAAATNRRRRIERDAIIYEIAKKDFYRYKNDPLFILGIGLYWAEGGKTQRQFKFTNSDSVMTRTMLTWIEKYLDIDRSKIKPRLYIHKIYEHENCKSFWSRELGIPETNFMRDVYKPATHNFKRHEDYKGCIRIDVGGVNNWVKFDAWQKLLVENLKI